MVVFVNDLATEAKHDTVCAVHTCIV